MSPGVQFRMSLDREFIEARGGAPNIPDRRIRLRGLYISVDRQDYIVNWSDRAFKRNTRLIAIGSADNFTGYVFGMHVNYDPDADRERIEGEAVDRRRSLTRSNFTRSTA